MTLTGKSIVRLRLHQSSHAAGFGLINSDLDTDSSGKLGEVSLTLVDQGVLFEFTNKDTKKREQVFIPISNVVSAQFKCEE